MAQVNLPLLHTKLQRPRLPRTTVARPHLWAKLDRGLDNRLILVAAGAGFGKTTLVTSWLEDLVQRSATAAPPFVAWLTLDENDGDLVLFLRYFVAAVHTVRAGACAQTDALLYALRKPRPELLLATLSNELAQLPSDLLLVLDDYSAMRSLAVDEFLIALLRSWPQPLHLVLITRFDPPLAMAALRAKDAVVELRSHDLRFSAAETAHYLTQSLLSPPDDSTIAAVQEHAEGWIAGIKLATLSLDAGTSAKELVKTLASSDVNVTEYLTAEVFSHQPAVIRAFLLQTSVLDHFCVGLCDAVVDIPAAGHAEPEWSVAACISWLVRSNLFIIDLDSRNGQHGWYRYHHLFRDMLRQRAGAELSQEQLHHLHQRAALWFAHEHLFDEAVRHALAAGDVALIAQVIEEGLPDALNREDWLTPERWLHMLPAPLVESHPWLLLLKAWTLQFTWQLGAQRRVLEQIDALFGQSPSGMEPDCSSMHLAAQIALMRGQHAFYRNQPVLALELLATVMPRVPESWTYVRGGAMLYIGASMQAVGQGAAAERLFVEAFEHYDNKADSYGLRLLMALCFNYYAQGKLEQVRQTAAAMQRLCAGQPLATMRSWADYFLGLAYYEWNQLAAAELHFAAIAERRQVAVMVVVRDAMHQLALLQQLRGESGEAWRTLEMLSELELEQNGREDEATSALRARLLLLQGDLDDAGRWADAFVVPVPDQPQLWLASPHLVKARILLARQHEGDVAAAQAILLAMYALAEQTYNTRLSIEILALHAVAHTLQGRNAAAQDALQRAIELARPGGFLRLFVGLGPTMLAMLARLPRQNPGTRRVLAAFGGEPQSGATAVRAKGGVPVSPGELAPLNGVLAGMPAGAPVLVEPLTLRELEVLALLGEPLSPKEIARKLDISHGTLKRHVANIYGKLGVSTRWDAVAQAKVLRLLPTG